jgi:hypothetical protein
MDWSRQTFSSQLPPDIDRVYGEVVDAYNAGLLVLAMAGMRIIFDLTAQHHRVRPRRLVEVVLAEHGDVKTICDHIWNFGNDAVHKARANEDEVRAGLVCVELLLGFLFDK